MNLAQLSLMSAAGAGGGGGPSGSIVWGSPSIWNATIPAEVEVGDVILAVYSKATYSAWNSVPAGFVALLPAQNALGTTFYKIADGTEGGTSPFFNEGVPFQSIYGVAKGVVSAAPAPYDRAAGTTSVTIPGIAPTGSGLVVTTVTTNGFSAGVEPSITQPPGSTLIAHFALNGNVGTAVWVGPTTGDLVSSEVFSASGWNDPLDCERFFLPDA